ncbi:DUF934 domain-containing protein [Rhodovulum imhoffii]|uniref:DUF934 domain-containing protein n=1 Tax=Rhodovulum imhoffii TaxID=365340 RepID=UPI0014728BCE|nr:DUF934 domain-containing protein [Rhodovulum imhoffii]
MNVIVTEAGFAPDNHAGGFVPLEEWRGQGALDLPADCDPASLLGRLDGPGVIRIVFGSFTDGRGFTVARRLRMMGYAGQLRASGPLIADQFPMALRSGFNEVEISPAQAERQPWAQWRASLDRPAAYQERLRASCEAQ